MADLQCAPKKVILDSAMVFQNMTDERKTILVPSFRIGERVERMHSCHVHHGVLRHNSHIGKASNLP
jgi:hypothetical protein